ncbi:MAG: phosphopyruvate hydratase [Candidatus Paceibacterota bacterium]
MDKTLIQSIKAREILDSRGNPTVEVECATSAGVFVDSVPSGASTGEREAVELRDQGKRYGGKGVLAAVENINDIIAPKLLAKDAKDQEEIDNILIKLDDTPNKSKLGANATLAVSMAVCRAAAGSLGKPLYAHIGSIAKKRKEFFMPRACFNVINGGAHAGNDIDFQEFMVVPKRGSFEEDLRAGSEIYYQLKGFISQNFSSLAINVGDEGGFAPPLTVPEVALGLIVKAIQKSKYFDEVDIILDTAASQFYAKDGTGGYYKTQMGVFTTEELLNYYENLIRNYPIIGIEDPFEENDWKGFVRITETLGKNIMVVGDDLLVSNSKYIKEAKEKNACNAVLLKLNQIGTVTELINSAKLAQDYGWKIIISHRSGETTDDFIADLAVGVHADFIKAGAPARGERVAKYNRLLKIEKDLLNIKH